MIELFKAYQYEELPQEYRFAADYQIMAKESIRWTNDRKLILKELHKEIENYGLQRKIDFSWFVNKEVEINKAIETPLSFVQSVLPEQLQVILNELIEISAGYTSFVLFSPQSDTYFHIDYSYPFSFDENLALRFVIKYGKDNERLKELGFKTILIDSRDIKLSSKEREFLDRYFEEVSDYYISKMNEIISNKLIKIMDRLNNFLKELILNSQSWHEFQKRMKITNPNITKKYTFHIENNKLQTYEVL